MAEALLPVVSRKELDTRNGVSRFPTLRHVPGAVVASLAISTHGNPDGSAALELRLAEIEQELRERYAGLDRAALLASSPFDVYDRYTRSFGQNYHVLHQVESVALKGKSIPRRAALVDGPSREELSSGPDGHT